MLGNIQKDHLIELVASPQQLKFGQDKRDTLPRYCRECSVRFACHGECPKNRFIETPDGEPGLNYLCAGFKLFFQHIDFSMKLLAGLIRRGREAQEVMGILDRAFANVDRNDPCPCGSGRKFKQCMAAASRPTSSSCKRETTACSSITFGRCTPITLNPNVTSNLTTIVLRANTV